MKYVPNSAIIDAALFDGSEEMAKHLGLSKLNDQYVIIAHNDEQQISGAFEVVEVGTYVIFSGGKLGEKLRTMSREGFEKNYSLVMNKD